MRINPFPIIYHCAPLLFPSSIAGQQPKNKTVELFRKWAKLKSCGTLASTLILFRTDCFCLHPACIDASEALSLPLAHAFLQPFVSEFCGPAASKPTQQQLIVTDCEMKLRISLAAAVTGSNGLLLVYKWLLGCSLEYFYPPVSSCVVPIDPFFTQGPCPTRQLYVRYLPTTVRNCFFFIAHD